MANMNWQKASKRARDAKQPDLEQHYKSGSKRQQAYELGAKLVKIEGAEIETETEKAYLVVIGEDKVWMPKSKCAVNRNDKVVHIPLWLARKHGLLDKIANP